MKLVFIDNGWEEESKGDLYEALKNLERADSQLFTEEELSSLEIVSRFNNIKEEEAAEILFNPKTVIITYSMFVQDSGFQLEHFLKAAGRNWVKNKTWIDCSGQLLKALNLSLSNYKPQGLINMLQAIETNNVYTFDFDTYSVQRVRVKLTGSDEDVFKIEPLRA